MKNQKGFTLVELLVVISIIALLLAILIPSLNKAKEVANRIICGNHLKDFGMANATYANVANGKYVPIYCLDPNADVTGPPGVYINARWHDAIIWIQNRTFRDSLKYDSYPKDKKNPPPLSNPGAYNGALNMPKALCCPSDKIAIDWANAWGNPPAVLMSYGYNLTEWVGSGWEQSFMFNNYMGHNASTIKLPSKKLAFTDAVDWWVVWWRGSDYKYRWDKYGQQSVREYRDLSMGSQVWGPVVYRHNNGANIGFYDGHVQYMKKDKIFVRDDYYVRNTDTPLQKSVRRPGMWVVDMNKYIASAP